MLEMHLAHVDHLTASIERLGGEIDEVMTPFGDQSLRFQTIPGVGKRTAEVIVAEIGVDMSRFPAAGHLASWAGMCPGNHESAGKRRSGRARKGDHALRAALCEAAWAAARTKDTYLAAQFRHLRRRFGKGGDNKAVFALGHTMLVIAWHLLSNDCDYEDLGADYFVRRKRRGISQAISHSPARGARSARHGGVGRVASSAPRLDTPESGGEFGGAAPVQFRLIQFRLRGVSTGLAACPALVGNGLVLRARRLHIV